jgi:hypothetical protein
MKELKIEDVPVYNEIPVDEINKLIKKNNEIIAIGFDTLQIPRYKVTFTKY